MNKKPKIAILLFGQPRFIEHTYKYIIKEFNFEDRDVDYFGHFWSEITYRETDSSLRSIFNITNIYDILDEFNFKSLVIDNNKKLIDFCSSFATIIPTILTTKKQGTYVHPGKVLADKEYFFGQHISQMECFKLIKEYEQKNNFEYDFIIKARTDVVYSITDFYQNYSDYYNDKIKFYSQITETEPTVAVNALRIEKHTVKQEVYDPIKKKSIVINTTCDHIPIELYDKNIIYYNNTSQPFTERDGYYLGFNDWSMLCNRSAATNFFENWFQVFLNQLLLDKKNNSWRLYCKKDHTLQGSLASYYNIKVKKNIKRRDFKLVLEDNIKPGMTTNQKIIVSSNNTVDITSQLKNFYNRT